MNIKLLFRVCLLAILGALVASCKKKLTPLELYIEQTNEVCPMPISAHSDSEFRGISIRDSLLVFTYTMADHEVDWKNDYAALRAEVKNTLTSSLPEMQELLDLMLESKKGAQFLYQSKADARKEIVITFTPTDILNFFEVGILEDTPTPTVESHVRDLLYQTPLELSEGVVLTDITLMADTLHLAITLPEEAFMALKTQSQTDQVQTSEEMRDALQKTKLHKILAHPSAYHTLRLELSGVTSQEIEVLTLAHE
jgi:hypothetical protein